MGLVHGLIRKTEKDALIQNEDKTGTARKNQREKEDDTD